MLACVAAANAQETAACARIIKADVVAFDQPFFYNRLGAVNPAGMIYALRRPRSKTSSRRPSERRALGMHANSFSGPQKAQKNFYLLFVPFVSTSRRFSAVAGS